MEGDPWVVKARPKFEPVPVGMYLVKFDGVGQKEINADPKWDWFEVRP